MNNKQVLVYEVLESKNDLRSFLVGHIHCNNLWNFKKLLKYFTVAWPDSETRVWVFLYNVNTQKPFSKQKYGTESV